jgi:hypothetical protein
MIKNAPKINTEPTYGELKQMLRLSQVSLLLFSLQYSNCRISLLLGPSGTSIIGH